MTLPITAVVVHPDGAVVTRVGAVPVVDGVAVIRRLPLLLDPASVRVSLGGAPLGQVRVELDLDGVDRGERPEVVDAWSRAREALERCDVGLDARRQEREVLAGLAPAHIDAPDRPVPSPERWRRWGAVDAAIDARVAAIDAELQRAERERVTLAEQVAILARGAAEASGEAWWRRWAPTRRVQVATSGATAEVTVSYRVPGASWSPSYTLDADEALRGGRFAMRAAVVQHTGEDWSGVALTLTSVPSERRVDVPDLPALRLGVASPRSPAAWRPLPPDLERLFPEPEPEEFAELLDEPEESLDLELAHDDDADLVDASVAPPSAPKAAPAAAPMSMPMPQAVRSRAIFAGRASAAPARRPAPVSPPRWEVDDAQLDYGRLRMAGGDAAPGVRGRLRRVDESELDPGALGAVAGPASRRLAQCFDAGRADLARVADRALPPQHVLPAPIGGTDVSVTAAGSVDVPSDGRTHLVAVCTWPVELEVAYRAVPRAQARAFRQVTATVPYERPLLPGPVEVYVDGRLEITSSWSGSAGRGRLKIGLGAEDRLKLVRNVRYREESAGMFGGSRKHHTSVEVRVASSLSRPVTVELLERVPVPADDTATVELGDCTPAAHVYKGDPDGPILAGGRVQRIEVGPGAEGRAELTYVVTLGAKDELVGGDRRG